MSDFINDYMTFQARLKLLQQAVTGRLSNDVFLYRQFFSTDDWQEVCGEGALRVLKRVLGESIAVGMARVLDPGNTRIRKETRDNISLTWVFEGSDIDQTTKQQFEAWEQEHSEASNKLKSVRNRYLAHLDLQDYISPEDQTSITHEEVIALWDSLVELLNQCQCNDLSTCIHEQISMPTGDAETLIMQVKRGMAYSKLWGQINHIDFTPQDALKKICEDAGYSSSLEALDRSDYSEFPTWAPEIRSDSSRLS